MKKLIFAVLALMSCRESGLQIANQCGDSCYTVGLHKQAGIGLCKAGTWVCGEDKDITKASCEGQIGPSEEVCDNQDNDCDGVVDSVPVSCDNKCGKGLGVCTFGVIKNCSAPEPQAEVCNGKDDDCDGIIDNADKLPVVFCYTGPNGTVTNGICHPGTQSCLDDGGMECGNQQIPKLEICNGLDDNCDGKTDDGLASSAAIDFVFILDESGSMTSSISSLKAATATFATKYNQPDIKFALVGAPDGNQWIDGKVTLIKNLSTSADFNTSVNLQIGGGGSSEATIDALYFVCDIFTNPLNLQWTANSRHVIVMFTDEEPQSYVQPLLRAVDVVTASKASNTRIYIFTETSQYSNWGAFIPAGNGALYDLKQSTYSIVTDLSALVKGETCK